MDKLPPCDIDAERAVVSAALLSADALGIARDVLTADKFFDLSSRLVYEALCRIDDSGSRPDILTVTTALRDTGALDRVGGSSALLGFFDASPDVTNVEAHCEIVADKARLRKIIDICRVHAVAALGDVGDVGEYCERVEREILSATNCESRADAPQTLHDVLKEEMPKITERQRPDWNPRRSEASAFKSGIVELDQKLWGGLDKNLYILAARPGMGKSAFAGTFALNIARGTVAKNGEPVGDGKSVVFFSCEMPKEQLAMRFLSMESLVPYKTIKLEKMAPQEWNAVLAAAERISKYPISLHHEPGAHVQRVKSIFRREFGKFENEHGLGIIDYIQLLRGDVAKGGNREQEVASISRHCMTMPKELGCPILALSQLNRALEQRPNKRPIMSDLRESGAIEQDAYGIIFLYRDGVYHPETERPDDVEIIIAKNRNGEPGTVIAKFDGPCTRFYSENQDFYDNVDDLDNAIGGL